MEGDLYVLHIYVSNILYGLVSLLVYVIYHNRYLKDIVYIFLEFIRLLKAGNINSVRIPSLRCST